MTRNDKYYLTDLGIGQIKNSLKKHQFDAYLENIVYIELQRRGYSVCYGNLQNGGIDFIVEKDGKREYYQVCYLLADENAVEREFGAFEKINDNYPKFVLSLD